MNTEITELNSGWILYDGECAICRGWVARSYRMVRRRGFKFATLQSPWVQARFGLSGKEPLSEMKLALPNGVNLGGADALIEIARAIWWGWPVYMLSRLPGVMTTLRAGYRWLAARRHCLGGTCRLPATRNARPGKHGVSHAFFELP